MARYILIDNASGYIWGDSADLNGRIFRPIGLPEYGSEAIDRGAVQYAKALDESLGARGREYDLVNRHNLASNETGYHAYRADVGGSDAVPLVRDGQCQETIEAVECDCEYLCTIRTIDLEGWANPDIDA